MRDRFTHTIDFRLIRCWICDLSSFEQPIMLHFCIRDLLQKFYKIQTKMICLERTCTSSGFEFTAYFELSFEHQLERLKTSELLIFRQIQQIENSVSLCLHFF